MPDVTNDSVDLRDHRLDMLEAQVDALLRVQDDIRREVGRIGEQVASLQRRALLTRDPTPLERQLLDEQMERSLSGDVVRYYRRRADRGRRGQVALLAAILAAASAAGAFIEKLIGIH